MTLTSRAGVSHAARSEEGYTEFSDAQAVDLLNAALDNSQIKWIIRDYDIRPFFRRVFESASHLLTDRRRRRLAEELGLAVLDAGDVEDTRANEVVDTAQAGEG